MIFNMISINILSMIFNLNQDFSLFSVAYFMSLFFYKYFYILRIKITIKFQETFNVLQTPLHFYISLLHYLTSKCFLVAHKLIPLVMTLQAIFFMKTYSIHCPMSLPQPVPNWKYIAPLNLHKFMNIVKFPSIRLWVLHYFNF